MSNTLNKSNMIKQAFISSVGTHGPKYKTENGKWYVELWHNGKELTECPFDTEKMAREFIELMRQTTNTPSLLIQN